MVLASEWLEQQYPNKAERKNVKEIHINEQLEGELDLSDFTYSLSYLLTTIDLLKIYLYPHLNHNQYKIINKSKKTEIIQLSNANEYLAENYPKEGGCVRKNKKWKSKEYEEDKNYGKKRSEITKLDLREKNLIGILDLSDFVNLEELDCSWNKLTNLIFPPNDKLRKLSCYGNQIIQIILPQPNGLEELRCPSNQLKELDVSNCLELKKLECNSNKLTQLILPNSKKLTELSCYSNQLTSLNLTNYPNLKELSCSLNKLTEIILPQPNGLERIDCNFNQLTSFDYTSLNPQTLTALHLERNNNLAPTDISVFSQLINLTDLEIDDNKFFGSLESLKNLTKLKKLSITRTNINQGLEYLPESLETFYCNSSTGYNWQVQELENQLNSYSNFALFSSTDKISYLKKWKKDFNKENPNFHQILSIKNQLTEKDNQINSLEEQLNNNLLNQIDLEKLQSEKTQLEQELKHLKSQLNEILTQESTKSLASKEAELDRLKKKFSKKKEVCEDLLEAVDYLTNADISTNHDHYWNIKEKNTKRLREANFTEEEINNLCDLQNEVTQLKLKLEELAPKKQLLLTSKQKEQLLLEFTDNPIFTKNLLAQLNNYLTAKQSFINLRQETITLLQEVVDLIERQTLTNKGKYVKMEDGINLVKAVFKIEPISVIGFNDLLGESVSVTFNHFKRRFNEKNSEIFKQHLEKSDNITELVKQRNFLWEIINKHPHFNSSQQVIELFNLNDSERIFNEEYQIYKVATNIWKNKIIITVDDMKSAISELGKNVNALKRELKQENNEISKLSGGASTYQLQKQIEDLKIQDQLSQIEISK